MINKPDIKNYYFITFIMELANIFGSEMLAKQCDKYGYKVTFPKDINKKPLRLRDLI